MAKTLRNELFQSQSASPAFSTHPVSAQGSLMEQRYLDLRGQVAQLSEQLVRVVAQFNEYTKSSKSQFQELQQAVAKLSEDGETMHLETAQGLTQMHNRIGERKTLDSKIQEMMDRHNTVLKSYELRLLQMNRLLQEKEAQAVSARAELSDLKMELARLKRM